MAVRERTWRAADGSERSAWIAEFKDQHGNRRLKTFKLRKEADAWLARAKTAAHAGTYTPESTSATVGEAIGAWLERAQAEGLEAGTQQQYEQLAEHIRAQLPAGLKLAKLSRAQVEHFRDNLLTAHSRPMARKVLGALKSALKDAQRRGLVAQNVAAETTIGANGRHKRKLKAGVDFPTPAEVAAMLKAANPKAKAAISLAARAGLRASEIRGLRWSEVQLGAHPTVTVAQRADKWSTIGSPKSEASRRDVPLSSETAQAVRAWKLAQPPGRALVFGTASDKPDMLGNLQKRLLSPLQVAAGIAEPVLGEDDKPVMEPVWHRGKPVLVHGELQLRKRMQAKYSWHALRHYAVSAWLAARIDPKTVQHWAGHSTLALTLDTYGHLIPREDDHARIEAAEGALLG